MIEDDTKLSWWQLIYIIIVLIAYPALILSISGDWFWIEGWIYNGWFIAMELWILIYLHRHHPALLKERFKRVGTGGEKKWDKYFVYVLIITYITWLIIIPLDARRYQWTTHFPIWLEIIGGIGLIISFYFFFRAFVENPFASHLVRIQSERKQYVVSTGVYRIVRHPMYLGGILLFLGTPLLLGSKYGFLIGIMLSLLFVGRIIGEEKMLVEELEGYAEYKKKVKYRLIPFIW